MINNNSDINNTSNSGNNPDIKTQFGIDNPFGIDNTPLVFPTDKLRARLDSRRHAEFYDRLRDKWVAATPEERVRQCFVDYLIDSRGYWPSRMANEVSLTLNDTRRRVDTVVYDRYSRPVMLIEYKAPDIKVTRRTFEQVMRYNLVLHAPYLVVTNGLHIHACHIDPATGRASFLTDLPPAAALR